MTFDIFISYSKKDKNLAFLIHKLLFGLGLNVFIDEKRKEFNTTISEKIAKSIEQSDYLIALFTKNGLESQWVNQEVGYAYAKGNSIVVIRKKGIKIAGFVGYNEHILYETTKNGYLTAVNLFEILHELVKYFKQECKITYLKLECPYCYKYNRLRIPSKEKIRIQKKKDENFNKICIYCEKEFEFGRETFLPYSIPQKRIPGILKYYGRI